MLLFTNAAREMSVDIQKDSSLDMSLLAIPMRGITDDMFRNEPHVPLFRALGSRSMNYQATVHLYS